MNNKQKMKIKVKQLLIAISICLFLFACSENKLVNEYNSCTQYTDLYFFNYDSLISDPLNVISMNVVGDCLQLRVSYAGCTRDHPIKLAYMHPECGTPPLPPPTFEIRHDSRGEHCKMLVTNQLSFDLTPLQTDAANEVTFTVFWPVDGDSIKSIDLLYKY
jgi:hypothetical protein